MLLSHGVLIPNSELLEAYALIEAKLERGPYLPYRTILEEAVRQFGLRYNFLPTAHQVRALPESMRQWQPFPDTVEALRKLGRHFCLAVISNVDDDLFAYSAPKLGALFAAVVTAQQVKSYKPDRRNFEFALERLGVGREHVLHVAQSLFHDIAPASALGMASVWVNRRKGKPGFGATPPSQVIPDREVPDLATLAAQVERETSRAKPKR
jgi:2-haloacid dehalogenase